MERFLESQHSLMSTYLSGYSSPDPGLLLPLPKIGESNGHHPNPIFEPAVPFPEVTPTIAPVAASTAPAEPAPATVEKYDRDRLTDRLLVLVSQRTGYPKDMLGLDVDLEADLGIDSIKRIEILSEVTADLGTDAQSMATELEMEKLTVIRTLRGIIEYLDEALSAAGDSDSSGAVAPKTDIPSQGTDSPASVWGEVLPVQRALVDLVDCPIEPFPDSMLTEGVVLFTDDGRGIARLMADQLADLGQHTVVLGSAKDAASGPDGGVCTAT